jgi:hypothetical protein
MPINPQQLNMINENQVEEQKSRTENDEIRELIRKNYELTQEIHTMTKKIKGYITFQKVMSFIYLVLIVGPIILSFIYLPSLLKNALGPYQELLKESGTNMGDLQGILKSLGK